MNRNRPPLVAPSGPIVTARTYQRMKGPGEVETFDEALRRAILGHAFINGVESLSPEQVEFILEQAEGFGHLCSGRMLWVGGTDWLLKPRNFSGAYNCTFLRCDSFEAMATMMNLGMMGCGVGKNLEARYTKLLPSFTTALDLTIVGHPGDVPQDQRIDDTRLNTCLSPDGKKGWAEITVGDSREGWVNAYLLLLELASGKYLPEGVEKLGLRIDLSFIRGKGERLKGFGGICDPTDLTPMFEFLVNVINPIVAEKRRATTLEILLLIDRAADTIVAGNIRRFAGIVILDRWEPSFKKDLWQQVEGGKWRIDPLRSCLRMSNHTRAFHTIPTLEEVIEAVTSQLHTGEGALMFVPEALARTNADLLSNEFLKQAFITLYLSSPEKGLDLLRQLAPEESPDQVERRIHRYQLNPCFAEGTMILTREGHFPIESLVGKEVEVFDGNGWVKINNFRITGEDQPMLKVTLGSGQTLRVTPRHEFVLTDGSVKMASDLKEKDRLLHHQEQVHGTHYEPAAYLKGLLLADGTGCNKKKTATLWLYRPKWSCQGRIAVDIAELGDIYKCFPKEPRLSSNGVSYNYYLGATYPCLDPWAGKYRNSFPIEEVINWSRQSKLDFLAGYLDGDGTAMDSSQSFSYQCTSISKTLLEGIQLLLATLGIRSKLSISRLAGVRDFGAERGGEYAFKTLWRISIPQEGSIALGKMITFSRLTNFGSKVTAYSPRTRNFDVVSVEQDGFDPFVYCCTVTTNNQVSLSNGLVLRQCAEITGDNNHCKVGEVFLNRFYPDDKDGIKKALQAESLIVCSLLHHDFSEVSEVMQQSRMEDPIVAVCISGITDYFINAFGIRWLEWWQADRVTPWGNIVNAETGQTEGDYFYATEVADFEWMKGVVTDQVAEYCDFHGIKRPNRCTAVQPSGTKALKVGASPGFHHHKASRYIRRITCVRDSPAALAAIDVGWSVVPSQSCQDEFGHLLDDPYDPRVNEWLVEIPTEVPWANLPGADEIDISKFSAIAQFKFAQVVQKHYVTHNLSSTIELQEHEIVPLATAIHQDMVEYGGYISSALLARFDTNSGLYPRLPFEPISRETYHRLHQEALDRAKYPIEAYEERFQYWIRQAGSNSEDLTGPAGCDSDKCLMPEVSK